MIVNPYNPILRPELSGGFLSPFIIIEFRGVWGV